MRVLVVDVPTEIGQALVRRFLIILLIMGLVFAKEAAATIIDFESIASGTIVRDEFLSDGLKITGVGSFSAAVFSTGDFSVGDFGNSQTQWAHMGLRAEPTTLTFVDPTNVSVVLGVSFFSVRVGDGHPSAETFTFTYFDIAGNQLGPSLTFTTTLAGLTISATSLDLGALIGWVVMELIPTSASGAAFDDVNYTLAGASSSVPEPGTLALLGLGLAGMGFARRRKKV